MISMTLFLTGTSLYSTFSKSMKFVSVNVIRPWLSRNALTSSYSAHSYPVGRFAGLHFLRIIERRMAFGISYEFWSIISDLSAGVRYPPISGRSEIAQPSAKMFG